MLPTRTARAVFFVLATSSGCLAEAPTVSSDCSDCHGGANNPAPPAALGGITDYDYIGVGAHQVHLSPTGDFAAVGCWQCHTEVTSIEDTGHLDHAWPSEVKWGAVAKAGDVAAPWDHDTATCTVWCHGAGLTGGTMVEPEWTVRNGASACGACHGVPPPDPHPQSSACEGCHGSVSGPDQTFVDPSLHADGKVDF